MDDEKPHYGWYVKKLIVRFLMIGFIGLSLFIWSFFTDGLLKIILFLSGLTVIILFLWPGIGLTMLNITISDKFYLDKTMHALYEIEAAEILDVGCGTGRTAIKIAKELKNGSHLYGIDVYEKMAISGNALETVQKNAKIEKVEKMTTFQYGSATEIPFENERFDIVNVSSVLHELHEPNDRIKAVKEIFRVLKSGGYLYMSEWNRNSPQTVAFLGIFCFVFKNWNYWKKLIEDHGFKQIHYKKFGGFGIFSARKD